jgi:hypothetical protein
VIPAAVLGATKVAAALAFLAALVAIGAAYRVLARRLELERADELIAAEFERLENDAAEQKVSKGRTSG